MAFNFLYLSQYPIFDQLLLEEALLRSDGRNWCIVNVGSPTSIVMGISGKKEELIDINRAQRDSIPMIKRFSGGGTVIVDEHTLFMTFICQKELHNFAPYPEPILRWHEDLYREVFEHEQFLLRENDFVIADRKCGGNAQYIKKDRWLHHTSFLWDYSEDKMSYLLHPKKTPQYRRQRVHGDFLCRLRDYFPSKAALIDKLKTVLAKRYTVHSHSLEEVLSCAQEADRQATVLL